MKENDKDRQFDFGHLAKESRDIIYRLRLVPTRYYEYISPAITDLLGYTPEECYADPDLVLSRVHPDFRKTLVSSRRGQVKFDEYEELCAIHKDGRLVWSERLPINMSQGIHLNQIQRRVVVDAAAVRRIHNHRRQRLDVVDREV